MERLKEKHAADLTVAGTIQGGAPFVANTPRPQRTGIPNLRGLSRTLGDILDRKQAADDEAEIIRERGQANEFFGRYGDSAKDRKVLQEMIASSNPIRREQWQRASVNNYVGQFASRYTEALEAEAQEVAKNPGVGGLQDRAKALGQRILGEMEEEVGDLFRASDYQRDLFYGQINQLLGGRDGLGGLEAKALQAFSRAEEQAGDIAVAGSLSDQLVMAAQNARDPMNPSATATSLLSNDVEALQANYDDLVRGRSLQEAAALTETSILTAVDRLSVELDANGDPLYEPEELAGFLSQFASVRVQTPADGPGRPKKVALTDRSAAIRSKLAELQRATSGGSGARAVRTSRRTFDNTFAAVEREVDALAALGRNDPAALERSVATLVSSSGLSGNAQARYETLVRSEMINMRDERLGQVDAGKQARTQTFQEQILLTTDPEALAELREQAVDAGADTVKINAAIQKQLAVQSEAVREPALGQARAGLKTALGALNAPTALRAQEDNLFQQEVNREFQGLLEDITAIEDPIERAKAVRGFQKSPEYRELIERVNTRVSDYNTARTERRAEIDRLVNSGAEGAAWVAAQEALKAGLITSEELARVRKDAAKVADPSNYRTESTRSSVADLLRLFKAEGQSDASREKLTSGLLKADQSVLGLTSDSTADPAKFVQITSRVVAGLEERRKQIVIHVLSNPDIKGHVSKIAEVDRLFRAEVDAVRVAAGYGEGAYAETSSEELEALMAEVEGIRGEVEVGVEARMETSKHLRALDEREGRDLLSPSLPEKYLGKVPGGVTVDDDFMQDRVRDLTTEAPESNDILPGRRPVIAGTSLWRLDGEIRPADGLDFMGKLASQSNTGFAAKVFADLSRGRGSTAEKSRRLAQGQIIHHLGVPAEAYLEDGRVGPFGVYSTSPQSFLAVEERVAQLDAQIKSAAREAGMRWSQGNYYGGSSAGRAKVRALELQREYARYDDEALFTSVKDIPIDPWDTPFYTKATVEAAYQDPEVRRRWRRKLGADDLAMKKWWDTQRKLAR